MCTGMRGCPSENLYVRSASGCEVFLQKGLIQHSNVVAIRTGQSAHRNLAGSKVLNCLSWHEQLVTASTLLCSMLQRLGRSI